MGILKGDNPIDIVPSPYALHDQTIISIKQYLEIQEEAILICSDNEQYIEYDCSV